MSGCGLPRSTSSPVITTSNKLLIPVRSRNGRADALTELVASARYNFISRNRSRVTFADGKRHTVREKFGRDLASSTHQFLDGRRNVKSIFIKLDRKPVAY